MKRARVMFRGDRHMATADGSGLVNSAKHRVA